MCQILWGIVRQTSAAETTYNESRLTTNCTRMVIQKPQSSTGPLGAASQPPLGCTSPSDLTFPAAFNPCKGYQARRSPGLLEPFKSSIKFDHVMLKRSLWYAYILEAPVLSLEATVTLCDVEPTEDACGRESSSASEVEPRESLRS